MAEKSSVVIKKITVVNAGAHGGAWKVAFADFMTALMAFFLVMWLLQSSEEVKASVAEYFSTPSVIEYNFSNYGAELTLEKLFLDLVNEPLKVFMDFVTPADKTPNLMDMGHKKIVLHHLADQLSDVATNVQVNSDVIEFEVLDHYLFESGTANPAAQFVSIMEKVKGITTGLEDSDVDIESKLFYESVANRSPRTAKYVAQARADLLTREIRASLEHETVDVHGHIITGKVRQMPKRGRPPGKIKFIIRQKPFNSEGKKTRKLEEVFGSSEENDDIYKSFVDQLSRRRAK